VGLEGDDDDLAAGGAAEVGAGLEDFLVAEV
jgi:hypothetical protein